MNKIIIGLILLSSTITFGQDVEKLINEDLSTFNISNISNEVTEIKFEPVMFEGKNVFAKFSKGYYQGITSAKEYKEWVKESADEICIYLGLEEAKSYSVKYREKPRGQESPVLALLTSSGEVYNKKAIYGSTGLEIEPVLIFKQEEYYDGYDGRSVKGVLNTVGMLVALPFQFVCAKAVDTIKRDYGIFSSLTCKNF